MKARFRLPLNDLKFKIDIELSEGSQADEDHFVSEKLLVLCNVPVYSLGGLYSCEAGRPMIMGSRTHDRLVAREYCGTI
jgi:hypothetical protein